jgi:hypothetical protein
MKRCLDDDALLWMYVGDRPLTDRQHVDSCSACARRHQRLLRDIDRIERVLRHGPPRAVLGGPPIGASNWWAPIGIAALAVLTVGVWALQPGKQPTEVATRQPHQVRVESVSVGVGTMAAALFADGDPQSALVAGTTDDDDYAAAALHGTWPCPRREAVMTGCE